jgi:hypothetical protein
MRVWLLASGYWPGQEYPEKLWLQVRQKAHKFSYRYAARGLRVTRAYATRILQREYTHLSRTYSSCPISIGHGRDGEST